MPANPWSPEEDKRLIEFELSYMPREDMARKLNRPIRGIEGRLLHLRRQGKIEKRRTSGGELVLPPFPVSPHPKFTDYAVKDGDWCVTADYHEPFHNEDFCRYAIDVSKTYGVTKLAINGDFFNADAYSAFDKIDPEGRRDFGLELEVAGRVVEALLGQFTEILITPANHEERFLRRNEWVCSFEHMIRLMGLSDRYRARISTNVGPLTRAPYRFAILSGYRVTHPKNFRQIPMRVANVLAMKFRQPVVCSHGHRCGITMSDDGRFPIVDLGGMFDRERLGYLNMADKTYPQVNNGFAIIRNGKIHPFGEWCDWNFWSGVRVPQPVKRRRTSKRR